jgi:hypothetical protein
MKPFDALIDSAAAHGLLLNWFHQDRNKIWVANWRLDIPIESGFRASELIRGTDPFETLSRSLMVAIADLAPDPEPELW